jgi:hypothetical protein
MSERKLIENMRYWSKSRRTERGVEKGKLEKEEDII